MECYHLCVVLRNCRLDKLLSAALQHISRNKIQEHIRLGYVTINDSVQVSPSYQVSPGDCISVTIQEKSVSHIPQADSDVHFDVVYEDQDIIVIDKPAGLVVHPGHGNYEGTLVHGLMHHCGTSLSSLNGTTRPGIVHRIDKETSGIMIAAKNDQAHFHLARQFAEHSIQREYCAICERIPPQMSGTVETMIGRDPNNRLLYKVLHQGGKYAKTIFTVCKKYSDGCALVNCQLHTGRTHQVRVHMKHIGCPLIGDKLYNTQKNHARHKDFSDILKRHALHAYLLGITHPRTNKKMVFTSPLALDMQLFLEHHQEIT